MLHSMIVSPQQHYFLVKVLVTFIANVFYAQFSCKLFKHQQPSSQRASVYCLLDQLSFGAKVILANRAKGVCFRYRYIHNIYFQSARSLLSNLSTVRSLVLSFVRLISPSSSSSSSSLITISSFLQKLLSSCVINKKLNNK